MCLSGLRERVARTIRRGSTDNLLVVTDRLDGPDGELPDDVVTRIVDELAQRGEKAIDCLRTAAVLIRQAVTDDHGLRLSESAAYNLREALDAVVAGRAPAEGGLPAVIAAWRRYQQEVEQPDTDRSGSLARLKDVLRHVADDEHRSSYHAARLLGYLRDKAGIDPLSGRLDPIGEYSRLRNRANKLHDELSVDAVTALYDEVIAWFARVFTPPDQTAKALGDLARERWRGDDQLDRLHALATNPHQLRLFLSALEDPAWLQPLYDAKIVEPPQEGQSWPVAGLVEGLGRSVPQRVVRLLESVFGDTAALPERRRIAARFELLRVASYLGSAGHPIVAAVVARHPDVRAIRTLAVSAVKNADPGDPIVKQVADAVLNGRPRDRDTYHTGVVLGQLKAGLSADNVAARTRMLAAKVRRLARDPGMQHVVWDTARLTAPLGEERGYILTLVHHLVRALSCARGLGASTPDLLAWTDGIAGELGQRITCRILAEADDVPVDDQISHIALRLGAQAPTGDDKDLVDHIQARAPAAQQFQPWADALGIPTTPQPAPTDDVPTDWARVWQWSMVLPDMVLTQWAESIAYVSARYGSPDTTGFDHRLEAGQGLTGRSPYSEEELAALPVLQAAALISTWRPDDADRWQLVGSRELARALEAVACGHATDWAADPTAIVTTLREPVYVLHYFQALTSAAEHLADRTSAILTAAKLARATRWKPTILGRDDFDFEPDWARVDIAVVELAAALANHDGNLIDHLEDVWERALASIHRESGSDHDAAASPSRDALGHAINSAEGRSFRTVLALAGWEQRNTGAIRAEFFDLLDDTIRISGSLGMQYRAILALHRPFLETTAPSWLDTNASTLFGDDPAGRATFDLTLRYARPTPVFHQQHRQRLFAAARRQAENAVASLLVGTLNDVPGYAIDDVIAGLRGDSTALGAAVSQMAYLVQSAEADTPHLATATEFWRALLDADRATVPTTALRASGRWALVSGMSDDDWSQLTLRTLRLTNGAIDLPIEVADRCKASHATANSAQILRLLLGHGEPWERHYVAQAAIETLHVLSDHPDGEFQRLRTRLIELGHHDALKTR